MKILKHQSVQSDVVNGLSYFVFGLVFFVIISIVTLSIKPVLGYIGAIIVFIFPGYVILSLLSDFFRRNRFERFLFSILASIAIITFTLITFNSIFEIQIGLVVMWIIVFMYICLGSLLHILKEFVERTYE